MTKAALVRAREEGARLASDACTSEASTTVGSAVLGTDGRGERADGDRWRPAEVALVDHGGRGR